MTDDECRAICLERLADWGEVLAGLHATPLLCLGVGHDHDRGTLRVCLPEDPEMEAYLPALLRRVAREIEEGRHT
jgi:hypothetical protein